MLSRKSSVASSKKGPSLLRRRSVSSTSPTSSEMLDPNQKKKQAVAAAQRAFEDDAIRRVHGCQSSSDMRPRLSERNLNQLPSSRPPLSRGLASTARPITAPASTVASSDYGYSQAPSSTASGSNRKKVNRLEEESVDGGDYESVVVRRRESMRWHRENLTPARNNRQEADARKAEVESYLVPDYSPPRLDASTPSSFRRVRKTRSAFAVSQIFSSSDQDVSSVVFGDGSPQKKENSRKSMSFLRGGTEFMGEGRSRERRSYYMESSQRRMNPPIVPPEITGKYKGKNEKGEWGAMRFKKKARKMFGSMRRALGMGCGIESSLGSIPEQHVASSRMHFRDYITPEEATDESYAAPGKFGSGVKEKPKIRSNYVISKAPTLHLVSSQEMVRSNAGSVREVSPPVTMKSNRKVSPASMATVSTGTWNSTIASRLSGRTLRGNSLDGTLTRGRISPVLDEDDALYFKPPPRRERLNVDARRVYSALVKRFNADEQPTPPEPFKDTGYYMTPGIGLLPEEEGIFERHVLPSSLGKSSLKKRASMESTSSRATVKQTPAPQPTVPVEPMEDEYEAESPPPPVPKIPKEFLEGGPADRPVKRGNQREGPDRNRYESSNVENIRRTPRSSMTAIPPPVFPDLRDAPRSPLGEKFERPSTAQPIGGIEGNASVDTFSTSTDAALSACHLQMLRNRQSMPGKFASNENLRRIPVIPKRPARLEAGEGIQRSLSVLEYREPKANLPDRTRTPLGHDRPLSQNRLFRAGLRTIETNILPPISGLEEPPLVITKRGSRTSLSGRVSRMSMREGDVGLAVARQFGPVAGQRKNAAGNYGYRMRDEYGSFDGEDAAFI